MIHIGENAFTFIFFSLFCQIKYDKQPQTRNGVDNFGGLGVTIVDALDTLFIMGLDDQFQRARQ